MKSISIIIPAKNEASGLRSFLPELIKGYPEAEIIVVDDGSNDDTSEVCTSLGVKVVCHAYSKGNGAAIKSGARSANGEILVFMDGDGQHKPSDIQRMLLKLDEGYDMVVGARQGLESQANFFRGSANVLYNIFASTMVGHKVEDLTSGFRVVKADLFKQFLYLLPNGFSYPTTSTMAFFRAGYSVSYIPITALKRLGSSHLKPLKDGIRFLIIIFKIATLYAPLKVFLPISLAFFLLASGHYLNTYISANRFTNMSALLYVTSTLIFMMGLISEQITTLTYSNQNNKPSAGSTEPNE